MTKMITPTNHTTSAFFGTLECDTTESSMDEQSSIDCSQLMDSSTHTGSIQGPVQNSIENPSSQWEDNSNFLESVLEENSGDDRRILKKEAIGVQTNRNDVVKNSQPTSIDNLETYSTRTPMADDAVITTPSETLHTSNIHSNISKETNCPPLPSVPSRTLHTSNVNKSIAYKKANRTSTPKTPQSIHSLTSDSTHNYSRIGDDSDEAAAWVIHLSLALFCGLILVSVLLAFFVINNYGVVAMMGLVLILCFAGFVAWFVDRTILSKDFKLKPIRSRIGNAMYLAKEAIIEEVKLFGRDWNEQRLLANTPSERERYTNENDMYSPPLKHKRSLAFKMIMPIFALRRRLGRRAKQNKGEATKEYLPPVGSVRV